MRHRVSPSTVAFLLAATVGCSESMPTQPIASPADALYAKQGTTGSRMLYYDFSNVWIMNDDGSAVTRITYPPAGHGDIRPTKFAKGVAFVRMVNGNEDIYSVNLDGSGKTWVVSGRNPAASPSGSRLAYASNGDIHRIQLRDGAIAQPHQHPEHR